MIEEGVMKTKAIFDEERQHRYLLTKEWDKTKPKIAVILLLAGTSGGVVQDVTTACIINCVSKLGYGSVEITNLFSRLDTQIEADMDAEEFTDEENDKYILESAERAEAVVLGWGKADANNLKVKWRANEVMILLEPYKNKIHVIGDGRGQGYSAMFPKVRNRWQLVKLFQEENSVEQVAEIVEMEEEIKPKKKINQKTKK